MALLLGACTVPEANPPTAATNGADLAAFFERTFNERVARSPEFQSRLGIRDRGGEWTSRSAEFRDATREMFAAQLAELRERFAAAELTEADRVSYRLFERELERRVLEDRWRDHRYPVDHRSGIHTFVPSFLINTHTVRSRQDAEDYISRLSTVGPVFADVEAQLKRSAARGIVAPEMVFEPAIAAAKNVITGAPFDTSGRDSTLRADFVGKVTALKLPPSETSELIARADAALVDALAPAYRQLVAALSANAELAAGNQNPGVWALPDGERFYNTMLERYTTTKLTADEIHTLGLAEVARIQAEMRATMKEVGFDGTLNEFFEFTRTDPQFYYPDTDAGRARYLAEATAIIDAMREQLDTLFIRKPKADIIVKRVEPFREASAGKAFYGRPAADGSRPGIYYANLYRMERMPIYQMRALAYHEGIPGHHMQIAIQQELTELPRFRRFGGVTAFSEGWGLYSEWLPTEIDAYEDPYSDFGRLAMELWRACRLVVDTGMHAKRWSRGEAIQYLTDNTPNPEGDIVNAIERYLVYPGQATAYKVGMLKIMALRDTAERELGADFDVRRFHDAVLKNGPLPLTVLDEEIQRFIEDERVRIASGAS